MSLKKESLRAARQPGRPVPLMLRLMRVLFVIVGGILPTVMGSWAYRLWFRTRRFPESAAGKKASEKASREALHVDGIPVAVYSWGEGPVVAFVHGWSGRGSQVAAFIEPLLVAGYQVMAVDAPGHGNTPGDQTDILECARVLQALVERYGPVHAFITHSFGGMVLAYAMRNGLQVERAVLISAPATVEFLVDNFATTLAMPAAVVANLNQRLEQRFEGNFRTHISTVNNVRDLSAHALVIHDEDDVSVPWKQGQAIAAAWPGAEFLKTRGLGHGRILRDPETVRAAVAFISR